jgi:hypothetical protein
MGLYYFSNKYLFQSTFLKKVEQKNQSVSFKPFYIFFEFKIQKSGAKTFLLHFFKKVEIYVNKQKT